MNPELTKAVECDGLRQRVLKLEMALKNCREVLLFEHSLRPDSGWKEFVDSAIDPFLED